MPGAGSYCRTPHEDNATYPTFRCSWGQRCRGEPDAGGLAMGQQSGATGPLGMVSSARRIGLVQMALARSVEPLLRFPDAFFHAFVE